MLTRNLSTAGGYFFALVVTAAAVGVRALLDPWLGDTLRLVTLYGAVAAAAWYGGYRPAVLASMVGFLACDYWFTAPQGEIAFYADAVGRVGLLAYLSTCAIIMGLGEAARRAQFRAEAQASLTQTTLASIGDAVITTDMASRVQTLNAVAETLTGWSQAAARGQPLDVVFHIVDEATRAPVANPAARALREGTIVGLANHTVLIARDGTERPIDDSAAPIRDAAGGLVGCVLVFRDIAERHAAEKALRQSQEHLADFFDNANVGLHWVGPDGTILRVNQAELDLLGYSRDELVGRPIAELHVSQALIEDMLTRLEHGETVDAYQAQLRSKDGSIREVLINSSALYEDGKFIHCRTFTLDITERMRATAALRDSEEKFRAIADNVSQLAWMTDATGYIEWFNRRWFDYTGTTLDQMRGWGWAAVHHPEHVERVLTLYRQSWQVGEVWEDSFPLRASDGSYRWFLSRAVPIRDASNNIIRWFGTNTDITDQRRAEESLRDALRRRDEFLAMLAHEMRNPLAAVRHGLELVKLAGEDRELVAQARSVMDRQLAHLVRMTDDLFDVSRITRGKLELRKEVVELATVIKAALDAVAPLVQSSGHDLAVNLPSIAMFIEGDMTRLVQVLVNLLTNACKFTPAGGRLVLTVENLHERACIRVRDNGIGIAPDELKHVFEMFVQLDTSLERSQSGLGIGLTLVKQLVELHGGSVAVHSDGVGCGTEFMVTLPLRRAITTAEEVTPTHPRAIPVARRILVVDDNRDSADSLAMILKLSGHETHLAYDGLAALEAAQNVCPEVVLLDIGLPRVNGFDVCRQIRAQSWGKTLVMVALTGWGQDEDRRRVIEAGFDHHLVKPVNFDVLNRILAADRDASPAAVPA